MNNQVRRVRRINLTQHEALPEQECMPRSPEVAMEIVRLLTFDDLPQFSEILDRVDALVDIAIEAEAQEAMIGGAPYLIPDLYNELCAEGITPVFAFSKRQSVEEVQPDGSVKKVSIFKHEGFVKV